MKINKIITYILTIILTIILASLLGYVWLWQLWVFVYSLVVLATLFMIWRYSKQEDRGFLLTLFILGIVIRIAVLMSMYKHSVALVWRFEGFFSGDARLYSDKALEIANFWKDTLNYRISESKYGRHAYTVFIAFIYYIFEYNPLIIKFINCFFGSIAFIAFYFLAKHLFDIKVARLTSILIIFFPSLIRWSITGLKDPLIILFFGIAVLFILRFYRSRNWLYLVTIIPSLIVLNNIQNFMAKIIIFAISSYIFFITPKLSKKAKTAILLLLLIPFLAYAFKFDDGGGNDLFRYIVSRQGAQTQADDSGYYIYDKSVSKAKGPMAILLMAKGIFLRGMPYALFSPFPWTLKSKGQIIAYPQVFIWYFLFLFAIVGIFNGIKNNKIEVMPIALCILFFVIVLSTAEGNVGAVFRHRDMIVPLLFIFSASGIIRIFERIKQI